jgi:hypothetical protein
MWLVLNVETDQEFSKPWQQTIAGLYVSISGQMATFKQKEEFASVVSSDDRATITQNELESGDGTFNTNRSKSLYLGIIGAAIFGFQITDRTALKKAGQEGSYSE